MTGARPRVLSRSAWTTWAVRPEPLAEPADTGPADKVSPALYNEHPQAGAWALLLRSWTV
jgi:hypothetical protein